MQTNYPIKKITKTIKGESVDLYVLIGKDGKYVNNIMCKDRKELEGYRDRLIALGG